MKKVLIFGGSGNIGTSLIKLLTKKNYIVTVVTRNLHQKGIKLKTQGNPGYLEILEANIFNEDELNNLFHDKDICINLVGILFEKKKNTFKNIHVNFPAILSKKCTEYNLKQFIHISALGIEKAVDSNYALSKLEGEKVVLNNFSKATILKPSIVFGQDDQFSNRLLSLLSLLPIFPLYYNGKTKFSPIHVSEICEIIFNVIEKNICSEKIECVGPEELSFKQILQKLLVSINKKRFLFPVPLQIAKVIAFFFEKFPKPLITRDQLRILKYDNVLSGQYKSNKDVGLEAKLKFDNEILKYSYMWKEGGQYSK